MKKMILIDGSNLMFRAYYATAYSGNIMQNSKGQYTNAVFSFVNMMNTILNEDFTHILVAFDKGKETFRHKEYPDYKGGRPPMPEEFRSQLDLIRKSLDVLGVKQREIELIEADDIIGTYATTYYDQFDEIEIISNDNDLLQLVNDKVSMRTSKMGKKEAQTYTPKSIEEKYGLTPSQITDLKGLMGDSSDNLKGVPGVGEKTAIKLLKEYETIDNLLHHTNELKGKLKEKIMEHSNDALLCKKIATIKTDVKLKHDLDDIVYHGVKEEEMIEFFNELELHSLIKKYNRNNNEQKEEWTYKIIRDVYELDSLLNKDCYLTLEIFGENYHQAKALGFGLVQDKKAYFIPFSIFEQSLNFQMYLADDSIKKYVFDAKMMYVVLKNYGYDFAGIEFDLLLAAYVLNPNNTKDDFRVIVSNFDYDDVHYLEEVYGKGSKYHIPEEKAYAHYAVQKAYAIYQLEKQLMEELNDNDQYHIYYDIERPLAIVLAKMEKEGIKVDQEKLDELDKEIQEKIDRLTKTIHELAGEDFNISSPKQLGEILFEKIGLKASKKTKTGYSTNIDVLNKLLGKHPIIEKIIDYRMLTKLHSTYIIGLKNAVFEDGKIHTIYRQAFTSTGRLSSIEPNLQNIPIRYQEGREIRKVFIPSEGNQLIASDYSQIELRVLAHMAKEETLIKAFKNNQDIHKETARKLFEKEEISDLERRQAKAVNFGIVYGQSAYGLSEGVNISRKEAEKFINKYNETFSGIKSFMDSIVEEGKEKGYVTTIMHRRRYIPELNSSVYMQREQGKRNAQNAPVQGSAADIIKLAMIKLDEALTKKQMKSKMLLQIHDELVFDCVPSEQQKLKEMIKDIMENCIELDVPLKVDTASGNNLFETK
jgi:DNA polymerase-1